METPKKEKVYYSIGEVAEMFQVNTSLIRFWEKEFDILRPKKNAKGNRLFTPRDVKYLHMIYHLVKEKGYTLQGAKDALKENAGTIDSTVTVKETLLKARHLLTEIEQALNARLQSF
ncbi:MAG: MerR family transcriptional regulator [Bacteroidales bacterium]|nr:MerR family transcriptional regulator [Bacteroidales bacterium]